MGESKTVRTARLCAAVTAGLAATALLASCAGTGAAPGAVAPSSPSASASASPPSATPTAEPTPTETPVVVAPTATAVPADRIAVVPFITSATWDAAGQRLDVSAIVPELVETGGTCTLSAVSGGDEVTKKGPAAPAASTTGCSQLAIDGADLAPGQWQVQVSYSSDTSSGTSAVQSVTVG